MTPNVNRTAAKTSKVTQSKDVAVNASSKTASSKGEGKQMKQMKKENMTGMFHQVQSENIQKA